MNREIKFVCVQSLYAFLRRGKVIGRRGGRCRRSLGLVSPSRLIEKRREPARGGKEIVKKRKGRKKRGRKKIFGYCSLSLSRSTPRSGVAQPLDLSSLARSCSERSQTLFHPTDVPLSPRALIPPSNYIEQRGNNEKHKEEIEEEGGGGGGDGR